MNEPIVPPPAAPGPGPEAADPGQAYRQALRQYDAARLRALLEPLGGGEKAARAGTLAAELADRLESPATLAGLLAGLDPAGRVALGLFGFTEAPVWPAAGLARALRLLGLDPAPTLDGLLATGLLAERPPRVERVGPAGASGGGVPAVAASDRELVVHPAALEAARTALPDPEAAGLPTVAAARLARESDGLEPILRLAALWQRVADAPLRQTQGGSLYKRDRDRLEEDPALAGPVADMVEPLPDMPGLWLDLAVGVGLLAPEPGTDRLVAARAGFWEENAVHLPQMIAARWLALRTWDELWGRQEDASGPLLAAPFVRAAALLWLAALPEGAWVRLDDLAALFDRLLPHWDAPVVIEGPAPARPSPPPATPAGEPDATGDGRAAPPPRKKRPPGRKKAAGAELLGALLGGMAYQLGLVRLAEAEPTGERVVQLSARGRYALRLGPSPATSPPFDAFLYVQPNMEVIAYRQGLTPGRIGLLSRFLRWSKLGAALELRLTAEDTYRGLESGLTAEVMLERLGRHSARPLGAGVGEALRTWSSRRERITYYMAATLIEFAGADDLRAALDFWDEAGRPRPVVLTDRLVLVEDDAAIPLQRLRMLGSRDYRRPPESCVAVEEDGVTLLLDPTRGDLFADAELARFADEDREPARPPARGPAAPGRRYRVTRASLARARAEGYGLAPLSAWFERRTGGPLPPAIRLLLEGLDPQHDRAALERLHVLRVRAPELLDGLAQHPATRELIAERLGPRAAAVRAADLEALRARLDELGLGSELRADPG
jgi:hypothetical protein